MSLRAHRLAASFLTLGSVAALAVAAIAQKDMGLAAWIGYPVAGWYITVRRPRNRVAWILVSVGVAWALAFALVPAARSGNAWLDILSSLGLLGGFVTMGWIPIIFPDGHPMGRRGRILERSLLAVGGIAAVATLVGSGPMPLSGRISPLAIPPLAGAARFVNGSGFDFGWLIIVGGGFLDMFIRWNRSEGSARLQYRWLVTALGLVVVTLSLGVVFELTFWLQLFASLAISLVPVSIGVAVLRYRLYDIDRIVSRTVTYGLLAVLVAAVYAIPVILLPRLLGESSDLIIAGSTLAAAAVFNPARRRIQTIIDRRFNRTRYDMEHQLDDLGRRLGERTAITDVITDVSGVLATTLQPESVTVWTRHP